jgi:tryptophanyl-tRNA synthetase
MRQFVGLEDTYESSFFIADYHALTASHDPNALARHTLEITAAYLAIGIDPARATIFRQSDAPAHTELAWIFNCITTMPYLMRAHAFKDAQAKNKEISVGTFDYPLLMAADILIQDADVVPVGKDQEQHVEIARDTAEKFNRLFGETFHLPAAHILDGVAVVPGLDGRKMSKSYGNIIPLFASDEEWKKAAFAVTTDSKGAHDPKDPSDTLFTLITLTVPEEKKGGLRQSYESGEMTYADAKALLAEQLIALLGPARDRYHDLLGDPETVRSVLERGGAIARERAEGKMREVRAKVGVASRTA